MPVFIDVEYVRGWRLFLVLSDGTTGVLDLTPWRNPAAVCKAGERASLRPGLHQPSPPAGVARRMYLVSP